MSDLPAKYHFHELQRLFGDYKPKVDMPCFFCDEPEAMEIRFAFAKFAGAAHEQLPSATLPKMDALLAPDPEPETPFMLRDENLFMPRDYVLSGERLVAAAIKAAGGVRLLARELGIRPEVIQQWKCVPAERLEAIAKITGLPQHVLRPDLFPDVAEPQFRCTEEEMDEIWKWGHAWQLWLPLPYPPGFLPACCCARRPRLTLFADRGVT